ncbi:DUF2493 domain-containing protein [Filomicrobium sp.]|uniref:DUF2493 domain-containing protein n=1 Tax=Filomicrobium sp. TaxID=2024831 RepID=UPI002589406E|nr:DUF2493 domain-containing protein [Filomicrobium sp.]MCV0371753.1 DUF2493 domain-containing protein [Filomicrobium sp.]
MSSFRNRSGFASVSATGRVTSNLALYGNVHGYADGQEQRPFPADETLDNVVTNLFATLSDAFADTALEPDVQSLLWSLCYLFHRKLDGIQRLLDENESKQRSAQEEQDGSEIRSVQLERLIDKGQTLLEKHAAFERLRDHAAAEYEDRTGSAWRPSSGSMVSRRTMTAAVVDSRDYISAKRRAETEIFLPKGPKIAFVGGLNFNDHIRIWAVLDEVRKEYPDMVLIHGGNKTGAEAIAHAWAANRKVSCYPFPPNFTRDGKAAPFKRNDFMLEQLPTAAVIFPGSGIQDNFADKALKLGIRRWDYRGKSSKGGR